MSTLKIKFQLIRGKFEKRVCQEMLLAGIEGAAIKKMFPVKANCFTQYLNWTASKLLSLVQFY